MTETTRASQPDHSGRRALSVIVRTTLYVAVVWVALLLTASRLWPGPVSPDEAPVRIATFPVGESEILTDVVAGLLADAGIATREVSFSSGVAAHRSLQFGDADVTVGYSGAVWLDALGRPDPAGLPRLSMTSVRRADAARGISWLVGLPPPGPTRAATPPANATFALVVTAETAESGIGTITDLAAALGQDPQARLCMDPEFAQRDDGRTALFRAYGIALDRPVIAASEHEVPGLVAAGTCVAGLTAATSPIALINGLVVLVDDLSVFPAFVVSPLVRTDLVGLREDLVAALRPMSEGLTTSLIAAANAQLVQGVPSEQVAAQTIAQLREVVSPA